ncbi:hypothetical protein [Sporomusa malonica]|uniref:Chemotaxis signal transduction protein n=1 Tax=Sporomusa malonica TaxID=112901 RepID=A0A1W2CXD2_9FIRM|nr:hypothetical protein [Sporomusa malonica]SMC89358.1 Chemotaxis signal transduction protein [Sporomusa malonica]
MEQNELQLLVFSIGDTRYGIDIDQIAYLMNFDVAGNAVGFEQLMAIGSSADCNYSKMLIIKQKTGTPILINEPDEVAIFSVHDIRRLPDILTKWAGNKGVWGLLPQERGVIILIDFYKNQLFNPMTNPL